MASYKDKNGVLWLIVEAADGNFLGTPDPGSERQYDDVPSAMDQIGKAEAEVAANIERFAAANRDHLALRVTARPSGLAILAILGLLVLYETRRR